MDSLRASYLFGITAFSWFSFCGRLRLPSSAKNVEGWATLFTSDSDVGLKRACVNPGAPGCKRLRPSRRYVFGYSGGYFAKPLCYVYGPFGRCTTGARLLP
jgi:hypothetical protein